MNVLRPVTNQESDAVLPQNTSITRWLAVYSDGTAVASHGRLAFTQSPPVDLLATLRLTTKDGQVRVAYMAGSGSGEVLNFRTLPPHHPDRALLAKALAGRDHCLTAQHSPSTGEACTRLDDGLVATTATGEELFPRIDPAIMVLLTSPDHEQVLLANNATWEEGRFSVIAGFVDAGENLESACCRECDEELGLVLHPDDFRYLFSDVWPFPRSLMVGFIAEASATQKMVYQDGEIRQARWFSRHEVKQALTGQGTFTAPNAGSLSHKMIAAWANGDLSR